MDQIICIVGPTATGKTALAAALANLFDGEVVSADSMQVYRRMDIGTAKPTRSEMGGVVHHMIDVAEPTESFSVARYVAQADVILSDLLTRGKACVVAGGTGLYIDSLIRGRTFAALPATGKRAELEHLANERGIGAVLDALRSFDPEAARRLHPSDRKRIIRAAEVYFETGKPITQHDREERALPSKYHPVWIGVDDADRQALYDRIDRRVDQMVGKGLIAEVQDLLASGVSDSATAMQAIGYKELVRALRGECSVSEAILRIKQESRRYAKRQRTWFRRNSEISWIYRAPGDDFSTILYHARRIVTNFAQFQ